MTFIRRYYGVAILIVALLAYYGYTLYQKDQFNQLAKDPHISDVYIFSDGETFSPYLLDEVFTDSLFFFSHPYDFKSAIPSLEEIQEDSFNTLIHYIYARSEIARLIEEGKIVKILR